MKLKYWTLIGLSALGSIASAWAGGGMDTGGGNLREIREHRLRIAIHNLKADLVDLLSRRAWLEALPGSQPLLALLDRGLLEDIQNSRHELRSRCFDSNGIERAGAAVIGAARGTICFNLPMLVDSDGTERDLLSLAIHEHAHQLGIADEAEAVQAGEAVALFLAARLVSEPRPDRQSRIIPNDVPEREGCLNFNRLRSRFSDLPADTSGFLYVSDISARTIDSIHTAWFEQNLARDWARIGLQGQSPVQWGEKAMADYYQNGCQALVLRTPLPSGELLETQMPIIEFSPTHIVAELTLPHTQMRMEMVAPEGITGQRFISRMRFQGDSIRALRCQEGLRFFGGEISAEYTTLLGARPERVNISPRLFDLLSAPIAALPEGCQSL